LIIAVKHGGSTKYCCFFINGSNSHYKNRFFESLPSAGFQKTDFGVSSAFGAGNTEIGFIMRIAVLMVILMEIARMHRIIGLNSQEK